MYVRLNVGIVIGGLALAMLQGCSAHKGLQNVGTAASQPQPNAPPGNTSAAAAIPAPYALTACSSGPMVQFKLQNLAGSELEIQDKDFALVVPGDSKRVIPYSRSSVTVELPKTTLGPNEMIEGRAVFNENTAPSGCRLVFKPYSRPGDRGTFADIKGPTS